MTYLLTFTVTLLGLAALCHGQLIGDDKCGAEKAREFAVCCSKPTVMAKGTNQTFPNGLSEANAYCKDSKASVACMKSFARKCLNNLPRQALNLLAYGMNKQLKNVCKNSATRTDVAKMLACNNKVLPKLEDATALVIDRYRRITAMDTKKKMPAICCGIYKYMEDLTRLSKTVCNPEEIKYLEAFINNFTSDILDLLCSNTERDGEVCRDMKYPNITLTGEPSISIVPPLLVVLESL